MVVKEPYDDCRGRRKLPLLSLSVVGSFCRGARTQGYSTATGVAIALRGVGLLL